MKIIIITLIMVIYFSNIIEVHSSNNADSSKVELVNMILNNPQDYENIVKKSIFYDITHTLLFNDNRPEKEYFLFALNFYISNSENGYLITDNKEYTSYQKPFYNNLVHEIEVEIKNKKIGLIFYFVKINRSWYFVHLDLSEIHKESVKSTDLKKEFIFSILENPNLLKDIILNSIFYEKEFSDILNDSNRLNNLITIISKNNDVGYEFKINNQYWQTYTFDELENRDLWHELGLLFKGQSIGISFKFFFKDERWYLYSIYLESLEYFETNYGDNE